MKIRVIALAVLQRGDGKLLLSKGEDTVKSEVFYRCIGGGVEFGEKGEQTLIREFREEIGKDIAVEKFLGAVENIFEWQGKAGHEIVLFYKCRFTLKSDDDIEHINRIDEVGGFTHWKSVEDIRNEGALLHPHQILEMLDSL